MNLLRAGGRAMLGASFIQGGLKALREPDALLDSAQPLTTRLVPSLQRRLPEALSAYVPEDPRTLVRLCGATAVLGGLGMATGIAPRLGAGLAALTAVSAVAAADPRQAVDQRAALGDFLTKLGLLGAALVVSQDTRGKPGVLWLAGDRAARARLDAARAIGNVPTDAARLSFKAGRELRRAARAAAKRVDDAAASVKDAVA